MRAAPWIAATTVAALARVAEACPSCAAAGPGTPRWVVALLVAVPPTAFAVTALVVRRLVARGGSR